MASVFLAAKYPWLNHLGELQIDTAVSVVIYRTAAAAGTILTSTPSYTSRVLGCLSLT